MLSESDKFIIMLLNIVNIENNIGLLHDEDKIFLFYFQPFVLVISIVDICQG